MMLPHPVSNPNISQVSDTTVTFEMPPIFCTREFLNHLESAKQTKGAPWPPYAISFSLKFETTGHIVSCAITEFSPICKVLFDE